MSRKMSLRVKRSSLTPNEEIASGDRLRNDNLGMGFFACPECHGTLECSPNETLTCQDAECHAYGAIFSQQDGIWRFLLPDDVTAYRKFIEEYSHVREAEGRKFPADVYPTLPSPPARAGLPAPILAQWRIRAASWKSLRSHVLDPLERTFPSPLNTLDLGAGNGWLSYQCSSRGHRPFALDLLDNDWDGLGAFRQYPAEFTPVQGRFEKLPFHPGTFHLVVFNASLHYAQDIARTLIGAWELVCKGGHLAIMDTPIYHDPRSGEQMVRERQAWYERTYGFKSDQLQSEEYLTWEHVEKLGELLGTKWRIHQPYYGWQWMVRPLIAKLRGHREPAQFAILNAQKS